MDKIKKNIRLDYIDIAKSLGMMTIVWGHIVHVGWSNMMVYSFHIPLFFFMSGMMFNSAKYPSVWHFIKRRAKTLLLPYLMFSFVTWILWVGMRVVANDATDYWYPLWQTFIAQGSAGFLRHNIPLWFVTCLFLVEVMFYFINKLPKIGAGAFLVICSVIGDYMIRGGYLDVFRLLPWSIEGAMSSILFYAVGYGLIMKLGHQQLINIVNNNKGLYFIVAVILSILLYFLSVQNGYVTIGSNKLGNSTWLFYLNGFIGIASMLIFCLLIAERQYKSKVTIKVMDYVKWFGRNSFYVMATHFPIKEIFSRIVNSIFHCDVHKDLDYALIVFVLTLIVDSIVVWMVCWLKQKLSYKKAIV